MYILSLFITKMINECLCVKSLWRPLSADGLKGLSLCERVFMQVSAICKSEYVTVPLTGVVL